MERDEKEKRSVCQYSRKGAGSKYNRDLTRTTKKSFNSM